MMGWVQLVCPPALTPNSTRGCPTLRCPSARVHWVGSLSHQNRPIRGSAAPTPGWRVVPIITWVSCLSRQSTGCCLSVANHRAAWPGHKCLHHTSAQAPTRTPSLSPDSRKGERHMQTYIYKTNDGCNLVLFTGCLIDSLMFLHWSRSPAVCHMMSAALLCFVFTPISFSWSIVTCLENNVSVHLSHSPTHVQLIKCLIEDNSFLHPYYNVFVSRLTLRFFCCGFSYVFQTFSISCSAYVFTLVSLSCLAVIISLHQSPSPAWL